MQIAKLFKRDRCFTLYENVEKEMFFYKEKFNGKTVYLNCDTPKSAFYQYFKNNFERFGLKKLMATSIQDDVKDFCGKGAGVFEYYGKGKGEKYIPFRTIKRPKKLVPILKT